MEAEMAEMLDRRRHNRRLQSGASEEPRLRTLGTRVLRRVRVPDFQPGIEEASVTRTATRSRLRSGGHSVVLSRQTMRASQEDHDSPDWPQRLAAPQYLGLIV